MKNRRVTACVAENRCSYPPYRARAFAAAVEARKDRTSRKRKGADDLRLRRT
jgi:hypothetical protein